ncbi:MAG: NAD(P)-dependent oxidoreductase [Chloroflexi bacterium]|nr:NAD(P)-dependent oxidoreductase [Chloroflexota bacterium]
MKVLLTGAFGNIGSNAVVEIARKGYKLRCFDVPTRRNRQVAARLAREANFETVWGDLRNNEDVAKAVNGCDVVAHIAFIIPPHVDRNPDLAEAVNVGGTRNILDNLNGAKLIFASSVATYGDMHDVPPPRRATDPQTPTDLYTEHKIQCEQMIRDSDVVWSIFRFSAVQPLHLGNVDPLMFEVPLDQRIEFLDTRDAGLAIANGVGHDEIWYKTLLIAGGKANQMVYDDYMGKIFDAMGVGRLPAQAFTTMRFHTDWMDTAESQALLQYQRYTFDEFIEELMRRLGIRRTLASKLPGIVKWWLLRQSPYYKNYLKDRL